MLAMKWSEIDLERAEWRIPHPKNKTPPRLSVDLDFNYIGSVHRETMRRQNVFLMITMDE